MFYKIIYVVWMALSIVELNAYELPEVNIESKQKPTIVLFSAKSIIVDNAKKYKLTWKTKNATHVQLTFFGNVKLSDTLIITDKEYQRGPITLTATSTKSKFTDSKTINQFIKAEREAPIIKRETQRVNQEFYNTPLPYASPYRRRVIPRRRY